MRCRPNQGKIILGMPAGGRPVTPPMMHRVDDLVRRLNEEEYYTQGFANDSVFLVRGARLKTLISLTASALRIVEVWYDS